MEHGHHGEPGAELEHPRVELSAAPRFPELRHRGDGRGDQRGDGVGVHAVRGVGIDREPVAARHDHGVHSGAAAQRLDDFPDRGHRRPT